MTKHSGQLAEKFPVAKSSGALKSKRKRRHAIIDQIDA